MKQVNLFPDRAATFVVHPTPGIGDATTIQEGLDMLPAGGGAILLREGTYPLTVTITLPVGKPVSIRGCGNSTVISLGANAIAAFTIPAGATTNTPIVFDNFLVTGTEVASQAFLEYADTNSLAEIYIENLVTTGVEKTVNVTDSAFASGTTPGQDWCRIHMFRCRIRPCSTDRSVIISNPSGGMPQVWMKEVEFMGDSLLTVPLLRTDPLFGKILDSVAFVTCYIDTCQFSLGGVGANANTLNDFAVLDCVNSIFWNTSTVNKSITFELDGFGAPFGSGNIETSTFKGVLVKGFDDQNFLSNVFQDTALQLFGNNGGTVVGDNNFIQVQSPWVHATAYVIQINDNNMVVRNNRFKFSTPPASIIEQEAPLTVIGNDFSEVVNSTNGAILIDNANCLVIGNRFRFAPTTGPNLREVNGPNYFTDNSQLFTNKTGGGPIVDPVFATSAGSTIQGTLDFNAAGSVGGTATNSLVVWYRNKYGLAKFQGYIENTGGVNSITVREQYITQNEGTFTRSTVLAPAGKLILDPYNFAGLGAIDNQVVDYRADVSGTAISWHTYFAAPNGVTAA